MSSLFGTFSLEKMNETDVGQVIVRPFLHALGYRQGTQANIRTEVPLTYGKAYLGHKDNSRDPILRGRPDYVCEVISFARWIIEAKAPSHALTLQDSQQAHTYATHPEIAAEFYLLTNGREFRVYRIGRPEASLMSWLVEETDELLPVLKNLLSPEAVRKRAEVVIDLGKPLAGGVGSQVQIVGGYIIYDSHSSQDLPMNSGMLNGIRNGVSGIGVRREESGLIVASIKVDSAFTAMDAMNKAMGLSTFEFRTSSEFVSNDIQKPSVFQNVVLAHMPAGTRIPSMGNNPSVTLPFDVSVSCYTQAVGYLSEGHFTGTFAIEYDFSFKTTGTPFASALPPRGSMRGDGRFDLLIK